LPGTGTGQGTNSGSTPWNSGNDKGWPGPRFPWGADPKYGRSSSGEPSSSHQLSAASDWISDPSAWKDDEENNPLGVFVDFPYKLDDKNKNQPTLLVLNLDTTIFHNASKMIRVEF